METLCGLDCNGCGLKDSCGGCVETNGRPFGGSCMIAVCANNKGCENRGKCFDAPCKLKEQLTAEFRALGIEDMEEVTGLHALKGSFANLEYTLPNGRAVKFWEDNRIYIGHLLKKKNSDRFYGLVADENYLMVCEAGSDGSDAKIVVFKERR